MNFKVSTLPLGIVFLLAMIKVGALTESFPHSANSGSKPQVHFRYIPNDGLIYQNDAGTFEAAMNFLLKADIASINGSNSLPGGTNIPMAKFYLSGYYYQGIYGFSYDAAALYLKKIKNLYVGYTWSHANLQIGQSSPYFGLENSASDNALTFLQFALPVLAFSTSYNMGVGLNANTKVFSVSLAVFGPRIGSHTKGTTPIGETLRAVYSPWHSNGHVLDIGGSLWQQGTDNDQQVSFSAMPEVQQLNKGTLVDTGTITQARNYYLGNLEFASVYHSFEAQGEYFKRMINRSKNLSTLSFSGFYATANYFLTGESMLYNYPTGYFIGITPIKHSYGAWQIAVRYSTLDLNDNDIQGGKETDYTAGLNWYLNQHVELMFNYIFGLARPDDNGKNKTLNIYAAQLQLYF